MSDANKKHSAQLSQIRGGIEAMTKMIAQVPASSAFEIKQVGANPVAYYRETPFIARSAAGILDKYRKTICVRVPFDGAFLLQNEQEVQLLTDVKAMADTISAWAGEALASSKAQLARNTGLVVGQFHSFLSNPALGDEEARAVRIDCAPLFSRIEARRGAVQATRLDRAGLRAEAAAMKEENERLEAENLALRTGAPPPPVPAARRRGSRR